MHQCVLWLRMDEIGSGVMSFFSKTKEEAPCYDSVAMSAM